MVGTEFDIDIAFRAGLFVLFQLLRNIVAVLGEDTGYFTFFWKNNGLVLNLFMACIERFCPVNLHYEVALIPGI